MSLSRRVVFGVSELAISGGVVRLLAVVTMPLLTQLLTPQAYGVAALAGTVISLVAVFALAGIEMSYKRAYFAGEAPNGLAAERYCWRFAIASGIAWSALAAVVWFVVASYFNELSARLSVIVAAGIILAVLHAMAQARARLEGRYRAAAISNAITGLVATAASVAIAVWWRQDAIALLAAVLLGYLIPVVLLGTPEIGQLARPSGLQRDDAARLVKLGLPGLATAPLYWVMSSSDRWFLEHYHGAGEVGVYSLGYSVGILGLIVSTAIGSVWFPEAVREYERDPERAKVTLGRLMTRLIAMMAIAWLAVSSAGGDVIRALADERFRAAADYVPWVAAGVFFLGALQLGTSGLLLAKKLAIALPWWLCCGVLSPALAYVLVPKYGAMGAALTQAISFAFGGLGLLIASLTVYRVTMPWTGLAVSLVLVIVAGVAMIPAWHASPAVSLAIKFPVGVAVAMAVFRLVAPDWWEKMWIELGRGRA